MYSLGFDVIHYFKWKSFNKRLTPIIYIYSCCACVANWMPWMRPILEPYTVKYLAFSSLDGQFFARAWQSWGERLQTSARCLVVTTHRRHRRGKTLRPRGWATEGGTGRVRGIWHSTPRYSTILSDVYPLPQTGIDQSGCLYSTSN